jgi:RecA/RadA recombinase
MSNAIKQGFDHIFYFDAEGGGSAEFFENIGCDTEKIEQILVSSVEEAQIKILEVYNGIRELRKATAEDDDPPKFLCVLDSLGALVAEKLLTDADKGKVASEMGGRSKKINSMIKAITIPALETDTAMICINHVYDDPAAMFAGKIKNQGGGKGLQYMGAINVQCTKLLEKDEEKDSEQFYSGTHLRFFTIKNRFARPSLECDVYLDFKKGFVRPFDSLWDEAIRGGFILNPKQGYYTVPSWKEPEKMFRQSQICSSPDIWKSFLAEFDKWSQEDLKYHKINTDEENVDSESVEDIDTEEVIEEAEVEVTEEENEKKKGKKKNAD